MSAFLTFPGIVTFLVLLAGLYGTYRLFRYLLARDRRDVPVTVTPEVARKHMALICLIRGGEALITVPILLVLLLIFTGFVFSMLDNAFRDTFPNGKIFSITMLIAIFLVLAVMIVRLPRHIFKSRRELLLGFQRISTVNVSNFAFIFAGFAAHDFYRLMPAVASAAHPHLTNRDFLCLFVFFFVLNSLKIFLKILLELPPVDRSQDPPDDRHIPEFPQKSPLLPL